MTVSTLTSSNAYQANGVTTVFPYTFRILVLSDLKVSTFDAEGIETPVPSGFTVSGVGFESGGNVTFTVPPADGLSVLVYRAVPLVQPTDYKNQGPFYGRTHEASFDRATMQVQQLAAESGRALRASKIDGPIADLPPAAVRAGKLMAFDELGNPTTAFPVADSSTELRVDLATSVSAKGAALVGFQQPEAGSEPRDVYLKLNDTFDVFDFMTQSERADVIAIANGFDATAIVQNALTQVKHLRLSRGTLRVDGMIELNADKTLEMMGGTTLRRVAGLSASTDPVVWIKGSNASFFGAGYGSSIVTSGNRCPKGVVRLGHKDNTESHANVLYCRLSGMAISGATPYGKTTGNPDVALYMPNPQFGGLVSYFHTVDQLLLQDVNIGMHLHGWANGNMFGKLHGYRVGNTTLGVDKNVFIWNNGALDNGLSDAFFHFSPDSIGMLVDTFDNTGVSGGSIHQSQANSYKGMVFEQGGAAAVGLKSVACSGSYFESRSNVAGGDVLSPDFYDTNYLVGYTTKGGMLIGGSLERIRYNASFGYERYFGFTGMAEDTTYKIVSLALGNQLSATIEIDFAATYAAGIDIQGSGKVVYSLVRSSGGTVTATAVLSRYTGGITPCVAQISGATTTIVFAVANNGTGTSVGGLNVDVKVTAAAGGVLPTFFTTKTTAAAGTPLAANI